MQNTRAWTSVHDQYRTLEILGQGTYGVVYKAEHRASGETVAMKRCRLDVFRDFGIPETTLREITLLRDLRGHDNVMQLRKLSCNTERLYMICEFLDFDLKKFIRGSRGAVPLQKVKQISYDILTAVAFCHAHRVLHRDLKPHNVLVTKDGNTVKIADFGLARAAFIPGKTLTHEVITLWYRAPELLLGHCNYTAAVDVWSVGCIIGELVSSRPLFVGDSEIDSLLKIFRQLGTPPEEDWPTHAVVQWNQFPIFSGKSDPFGCLSPSLDSTGKDLLSKMFKFNAAERITAADALRHPWFAEIYAARNGPELWPAPVAPPAELPVLMPSLFPVEDSDETSLKDPENKNAVNRISRRSTLPSLPSTAAHSEASAPSSTTTLTTSQQSAPSQIKSDIEQGLCTTDKVSERSAAATSVTVTAFCDRNERVNAHYQRQTRQQPQGPSYGQTQQQTQQPQGQQRQNGGPTCAGAIRNRVSVAATINHDSISGHTLEVDPRPQRRASQKWELLGRFKRASLSGLIDRKKVKNVGPPTKAVTGGLSSTNTVGNTEELRRRATLDPKPQLRPAPAQQPAFVEGSAHSTIPIAYYSGGGGGGTGGGIGPDSTIVASSAQGNYAEPNCVLSLSNKQNLQTTNPVILDVALSSQIGPSSLGRISHGAVPSTSMSIGGQHDVYSARVKPFLLSQGGHHSSMLLGDSAAVPHRRFVSAASAHHNVPSFATVDGCLSAEEDTVLASGLHWERSLNLAPEDRSSRGGARPLLFHRASTQGETFSSTRHQRHLMGGGNGLSNDPSTSRHIQHNRGGYHFRDESRDGSSNKEIQDTAWRTGRSTFRNEETSCSHNRGDCLELELRLALGRDFPRRASIGCSNEYVNDTFTGRHSRLNRTNSDTRSIGTVFDVPHILSSVRHDVYARQGSKYYDPLKLQSNNPYEYHADKCLGIAQQPTAGSGTYHRYSAHSTYSSHNARRHFG